ncbi:threonine-phosphate decarboxylase [Pseudooceanicola sp.]|uniref:threonine-phosphate decarboxylase n=1 Tax=Pseudooceanicola sp. TaxID=1914328 RepID=UPI0026118C0E|nr:threonine-phosphate decarboxylase [Pseudooceanicola sp.]MDF1855194.1 pyridoxal phosphate-dependent class II aminotransferase [Pseudooceanicola sp.]
MAVGRDHGGGLDDAAGRYGGARGEWIDLSTGINPVPYPIPELTPEIWQALPDRGALARLTSAARCHWSVPEGADLLALPGLSAVIPRLPALAPPGPVAIPGPTYNEYTPAFARAGWDVQDRDPAPGDSGLVIVSPNNPTGRWHIAPPRSIGLRVIDESFCDTAPERSLIAEATQPGTLILKGLGKFWGLAGLRLGFAIGDPALIAELRIAFGPWSISGPALAIGATALDDPGWAEATRARLNADAARLDRLMNATGAELAGGTSLFRLYTLPDTLPDAATLQDQLAQQRIWTRVFPWSPRHIRLGLPAPGDWARLTDALAG